MLSPASLCIFPKNAALFLFSLFLLYDQELREHWKDREEQWASVSEVLTSVFLFLISQMCSPKVFQKWMDGWYLFCQEWLHIWCGICIFCTMKMSDSKHNNKLYLLSFTTQLLCYAMLTSGSDSPDSAKFPFRTCSKLRQSTLSDVLLQKPEILI